MKLVMGFSSEVELGKGELISAALLQYTRMQMQRKASTS